MVDRNPGEHILIELTTDSDTDIDIDRFRKSYRLFVRKLQHRNRRSIVKCNFSAIRFLLIGIIFIVIGLVFASKMNDVITAIISTIGSFSIWEAAAQWIEVLPTLHREKLVLFILSVAEISVLRRKT